LLGARANFAMRLTPTKTNARKCGTSTSACKRSRRAVLLLRRFVRAPSAFAAMIRA
jgi:hypothetical protein